ncbi:MAG: M20/M25/M40 family metallo-hydrolase, partial [Planctomycetes bacterium]|nr:M20/M25/M40 family metallo-hydrolase [Planctomycetota bacterium]
MTSRAGERDEPVGKKRSSAEGHPGRGKQPVVGVLEPDRRRAEELVVAMLAIPGPSGREGRVLRFIESRLRRAGVPRGAIQTDRAHRRSPHGGEVGNLVCKLPGTRRGTRRMLMAHADTVPLAEGTTPVVRRGIVVPAEKGFALGADDRAGAAAVLNAALEILRQKAPHPPLTFLWTVQEELGLLGARHARLGLLGKPRLAFNFDGGSSEKLTIGATGGYRME